VVAGLATGLLAGVFGLIDFLTIRRARTRSEGWIHVIGNLTTMILALVSLLLRWSDPVVVLPWGLLLFGLLAIIVTITAWYGTELSHRHKIAMIERG
jgi:uncharacterized membrane protein